MHIVECGPVCTGALPKVNLPTLILEVSSHSELTCGRADAGATSRVEQRVCSCSWLSSIFAYVGHLPAWQEHHLKKCLTFGTSRERTASHVLIRLSTRVPLHHPILIKPDPWSAKEASVIRRPDRGVCQGKAVTAATETSADVFGSRVHVVDHIEVEVNLVSC